MLISNINYCSEKYSLNGTCTFNINEITLNQYAKLRLLPYSLIVCSSNYQNAISSGNKNKPVLLVLNF